MNTTDRLRAGGSDRVDATVEACLAADRPPTADVTCAASAR
ncbi:hypothetical protein AB0958_13740 [Streptomyces sp. NPDC006655]